MQCFLPCFRFCSCVQIALKEFDFVHNLSLFLSNKIDCAVYSLTCVCVLHMTVTVYITRSQI